uniref:Conotoxin n=1 Tax=Conus caracteristicus TaxID=89440 RepID=S4UJY4_CONCB|nr:T superfamily conotoxin Ca5.6 precursor [Conus caracteristicus]
MLCLPVFIILLLLASPAAPNPFETRLLNDLARADADMETEKYLGEVRKAVCCQVFPGSDCCPGF